MQVNCTLKKSMLNYAESVFFLSFFLQFIDIIIQRENKKLTNFVYLQKFFAEQLLKRVLSYSQVNHHLKWWML